MVYFRFNRVYTLLVLLSKYRYTLYILAPFLRYEPPTPPPPPKVISPTPRTSRTSVDTARSVVDTRRSVVDTGRSVDGQTSSGKQMSFGEVVDAVMKTP